MLLILTPEGKNHCEVTSIDDFEREKEFIESQGIDSSGFYIDEKSLEKYRSSEVKQKIDGTLGAVGIDPREQLVTVGNGLQLVLVGLCSVVVACSKSEDKSLKEGTKELLPFANTFINARKTGEMPIDVLGLHSVTEKLIINATTTGKVIKDVLSVDKKEEG